MREVVGCVSHGYRGIPVANNSSDYPEYYCPRGRKISQTRSHTNREITFDQVELLPVHSELFAFSCRFLSRTPLVVGGISPCPPSAILLVRGDHPLALQEMFTYCLVFTPAPVSALLVVAMVTATSISVVEPSSLPANVLLVIFTC